jgi:hypothetical protein
LGATGIGKTEMIEQWVKRLGEKTGKEVHLFGAHLSTIEATDVKGIGVPDLDKGKMVYLPPEFMPDAVVHADAVGAVFWDEINRGEAVCRTPYSRSCRTAAAATTSFPTASSSSPPRTTPNIPTPSIRWTRRSPTGSSTSTSSPTPRAGASGA